jgi:hypothetical protein
MLNARQDKGKMAEAGIAIAIATGEDHNVPVLRDILIKLLSP